MYMYIFSQVPRVAGLFSSLLTLDDHLFVRRETFLGNRFFQTVQAQWPRGRTCADQIEAIVANKNDSHARD